VDPSGHEGNIGDFGGPDDPSEYGYDNHFGNIGDLFGENSDPGSSFTGAANAFLSSLGEVEIGEEEKTKKGEEKDFFTVDPDLDPSDWSKIRAVATTVGGIAAIIAGTISLPEGSPLLAGGIVATHQGLVEVAIEFALDGDLIN